VANSLVDRAAVALASLAATAIARLNLTTISVPVALTGGLFSSTDVYRRTATQLGLLAANARLVKPQHDPAVGAARMAMES
jgi:N-acetylglucosamine kinase-like BadF-type ATPase